MTNIIVMTAEDGRVVVESLTLDDLEHLEAALEQQPSTPTASKLLERIKAGIAALGTDVGQRLDERESPSVFSAFSEELQRRSDMMADQEGHLPESRTIVRTLRIVAAAFEETKGK